MVKLENDALLWYASRMDIVYNMRPVGYVRSTIKDIQDAPRQGREAGTEAEIVVLPEFAEAIEGLDGRDRLVVVTWMDRAGRDIRRIVPRGLPGAEETGVLNTRTPNRPNPIGICVVELVGLSGAVLRVRGLDAIDGTPVVDIKPFIASLDGA